MELGAGVDGARETNYRAFAALLREAVPSLTARANVSCCPSLALPGQLAAICLSRFLSDVIESLNICLVAFRVQGLVEGIDVGP
jgi:hypothetical protein